MFCSQFVDFKLNTMLIDSATRERMTRGKGLSRKEKQ